MTHAPFRSSSLDVTAILRHLQTADRLLDAAPRTLVIDQEAAANQKPLLGTPRSLYRRLTRDRRAPYPNAEREYLEAREEVRAAARLLDDHPSSATLRNALEEAESKRLVAACTTISTAVRNTHAQLRKERSDLDLPALETWDPFHADEPQDAFIPYARTIGLVTIVVVFALYTTIVELLT
jgi:uncharacterized membrane protein YccC